MKSSIFDIIRVTKPKNTMKFWKPQYFYESLYPTFIFSTIVGVFPMFPIHQGRKYVLYSSKKLHLITVLLLVIYTSNFCITVVKKSNNVVGAKFYQQRNKVSNFGLTFQFIFGIIILYTIFAMSFLRTKPVKEVMTNINEVDNLFKKLNHKIDYRHIVWYQMVIIPSGLLMIAVIASMQIKNIKIEKFPPLSLHMWILFLFPLSVLYDMNCQYGITAVLIYQRLKMINYQLEQIRLKIDGEHTKIRINYGYVTKITTNLKIVDKINTLMRIHEILFKAANKTNLNYNVQMVPSLIQEFFISVFSVFYFYWMHAIKPLSASLWLSWGFYTSYEILQVAVACHLASVEAEIVGRKIHKALIKTRNDVIEEKLMNFSQQVLHSNFKFTLCGMFNIDPELLFNMIGSSTTFIIIMIQFQETITPSSCMSIKTT